MKDKKTNNLKLYNNNNILHEYRFNKKTNTENLLCVLGVTLGKSMNTHSMINHLFLTSYYNWDINNNRLKYNFEHFKPQCKL